MTTRFPSIHRLSLFALALALGFGLTACETEPAEPNLDTDTDIMADTTAMPGEEMNDSTIVDVVTGDEQFSTFARAFQAAGLEETLQGDGPFTVFAPTNEAFDQLPEGRVDELLQPDNQEELQELLTYHIHQGEALRADDIGEMDEVETMTGQSLQVTQQGENVMVGGATVTDTGMDASNGVVHAIDTVLMPNEEM